MTLNTFSYIVLVLFTTITNLLFAAARAVLRRTYHPRRDHTHVPSIPGIDIPGYRALQA